MRCELLDDVVDSGQLCRLFRPLHVTSAFCSMQVPLMSVDWLGCAAWFFELHLEEGCSTFQQVYCVEEDLHGAKGGPRPSQMPRHKQQADVQACPPSSTSDKISTRASKRIDCVEIEAHLLLQQGKRMHCQVCQCDIEHPEIILMLQLGCDAASQLVTSPSAP